MSALISHLYLSVLLNCFSGYKEILTIPASATNIDIQEMAPSTHFLGITSFLVSKF